MSKKSEKIERELYSTWLDNKYAIELRDDLIHDMSLELNVLKKGRRKAVRNLKKAEKRYEVIYGKLPRVLKAGK